MIRGKKAWDAVIIGGGHNGLVAASYLAKSQKKVLVLERRHVLGGAAVTEEIFPNFKFSRASYLAGLFRPSIIKELDLHSHGLKFYTRNPSSFTPMRDGRYGHHEIYYRYLLMGNSKLNFEEISKFSKKDAEAYPKFEEQLLRICRFIEPFLDEEPPNIMGNAQMSFAERLELLKKTGTFGKRVLALGKDFPAFLDLLTAPSGKILTRWFESEPLISTLSTDSIIGAMTSPATPGSGYVLLHHVMGVQEGIPVVEGGMGGISKALTSAAEKLGVTFRTNAEVSRVSVDDEGNVDGVRLADGEFIPSRVILSNATPWETFGNLCEPHHLPKEFLERVMTSDYSSGVTKINVALSRLPTFRCFPNGSQDPSRNPTHGTIHIGESLAEIEEAYQDALTGIPSRNPIVEMSIPSSLDPTMAPSGKHVASLFVQYTPNKLRVGSWEDPSQKEAVADRVFARIEEYAPGFTASVEGRDILSPLDLEKVFRLTGGNIFHSAMGLDQIFWSRPANGYANYRTPIKGLYLCGSGSHPGGGVMGAVGRNAARRVLKDIHNKVV